MRKLELQRPLKHPKTTNAVTAYTAEYLKVARKTFRRIQKVGVSTAQITIGNTFSDVSLAQAKTYNDYIREMAKKGHSPEQIKKALSITKTPVDFHARLSAPSALSSPNSNVGHNL